MTRRHLRLWPALLLVALATAIWAVEKPSVSPLGPLNTPDEKGYAAPEAVLHGTVGQVEALVAVGADVNAGCANGSYPLMLADRRNGVDGQPAIRRPAACSVLYSVRGRTWASYAQSHARE
jgi:hypothetical protein